MRGFLFLVSIAATILCSLSTSQHEEPFFTVGDLVFVRNLKPQSDAQPNVARVLQIFNNSVARIANHTYNTRRNWFEWTVKTLDNTEKLTKIKRRYLKMMPPKFEIIDTNDESIWTENGHKSFEDYMLQRLSIANQFTFFPMQLGRTLFIDQPDFQRVDRQNNKCMIRPSFTQYYTLFFILDDCKISDLDDFRFIFSCIPRTIIAQIFQETKVKLNKTKRFTRALDELIVVFDEFEPLTKYNRDHKVIETQSRKSIEIQKCIQKTGRRVKRCDDGYNDE